MSLILQICFGSLPLHALDYSPTWFTEFENLHMGHRFVTRKIYWLTFIVLWFLFWSWSRKILLIKILICHTEFIRSYSAVFIESFLKVHEMAAIIGSLTKAVSIFENNDISIDNWCFKLFYKWTTSLLVLGVDCDSCHKN